MIWTSRRPKSHSRNGERKKAIYMMSRSTVNLAHLRYNSQNSFSVKKRVSTWFLYLLSRCKIQPRKPRNKYLDCGSGFGHCCRWWQLECRQKKQKQNTTRIINDTTRKQTHEFTIWKLYYFVCLNYSPMLSTNLQSSNLITQRVKIKFHGWLEGLLSSSVLMNLSRTMVFGKTTSFARKMKADDCT